MILAIKTVPNILISSHRLHACNNLESQTVQIHAASKEEFVAALSSGKGLYHASQLSERERCTSILLIARGSLQPEKEAHNHNQNQNVAYKSRHCFTSLDTRVLVLLSRLCGDRTSRRHNVHLFRGCNLNPSGFQAMAGLSQQKNFRVTPQEECRKMSLWRHGCGCWMQIKNSSNIGNDLS